MILVDQQNRTTNLITVTTIYLNWPTESSLVAKALQFNQKALYLNHARNSAKLRDPTFSQCSW